MGLEIDDEMKDKSTIKIAILGPSASGKNTILAIQKAIENRNNPKDQYEILRQKEYGKTVINKKNSYQFQPVVFGLGNKNTSEHDFKINIYKVKTLDQLNTIRKKLEDGTHAILIVLDADKDQLEANKKTLGLLIQIFAEDLQAIPFQIVLNKTDLPTHMRLNSFDTAKLLVEYGFAKNLAEAQQIITETSSLQAINDFQKLLESGKWSRNDWSDSIRQVMQPIIMIVREILIKQLKKKGNI